MSQAQTWIRHYWHTLSCQVQVAEETLPHFLIHPTTICQKHESKMSRLIKMSKAAPVRRPLSVDIKPRIIECRWPLPAPGSLSPAFHHRTQSVWSEAALIQNPEEPLTPFVSAPLWQHMCSHANCMGRCHRATSRSSCAHILALTPS